MRREGKLNGVNFCHPWPTSISFPNIVMLCWFGFQTSILTSYLGLSRLIFFVSVGLSKEVNLTRLKVFPHLMSLSCQI